MGEPAAKQNDRIVATDNHLVQPPGSSPPVLVPHPYTGVIDKKLSGNVNIQGLAAATVDSTATNTPRHVAIGGSFVNDPTNIATIVMGSGSVYINGKAAARNGDIAETCNDPVDQRVGRVVAVSSVYIGG